MYKAARHWLFKLDAERSHELGMRALGLGKNLPLRPFLTRPAKLLPTDCFGLRFDHPVGLAAGLDKNADFIDALFNLGFAFVEVGTVTPRPQSGNPKPRLFRLPAAEAIINRLGFNNKGVDYLVQQVEASRALRHNKIIGINIGKNKDTPNEDAANDYLHCLERVYPYASYITVNISSPNTQGLRDLQAAAALEKLLQALCDRREQLADQHQQRVPLLLKLAPDMDSEQQQASATTINRFPIDGVICGNTTIDRDKVEHMQHGTETGGLSGRPLRQKADQTLQSMRKLIDAKTPIVGVGGITQGQHAAEKIRLGARLVQIYTGMIYQGPELIADCVAAIHDHKSARSGSAA